VWSTFDVVLGLVALFAGAVASVSGFGIGSLLTPTLALHVNAKAAVAAVSVPHLVGTAIRFWGLRAHLDRRVLWRFGLTSAAGGLLGALLHAGAPSPDLAIVLGALLVFAGGSQLVERTQRWRFHGIATWVAGAVSGFFGGLVGNQGGIRSAAMLGFDLSREEFVATATAIALCVDGARMPVYLVAERGEVAAIWPLVAIATAGVVVGTLAGERVLTRVPQRRFRQVLGVLILLLGVGLLYGVRR
jgi:uncharacterized membrane protein YfcA